MDVLRGQETRLVDARWLAALADNLLQLAEAARRMEQRLTAAGSGTWSAGTTSPFEAAIDLLQRGSAAEPETSFRREGDLWRIRYNGTSCGLRHTRGLSYVAELLRHPGRELHAAQLVELAGGLPPRGGVAVEVDLTRSLGLGDAGSILDRRATAAYGRRLAELREDLEEADGHNDLGRAAHLRQELAQLAEALATAGRDRRAASHAERARLTVTKGIKAALDRLISAHPALGRHLHATIRRGYFCSYTPDPTHAPGWVVQIG